jgi:hypothetical protein
MTEQYPLYTVLDVGADGDITGQHVEVQTSLDDAKRRRDELHTMAVDDREHADFRVFQLVEPGKPNWYARAARLDALDQAVKLHAEDGIEVAEILGTAQQFAAFLADGTVPEAPREEPFLVEVRWLDDEHIEIQVGGSTVAEANFDENGTSGLLAVEKAAVGVARALGVEPEWSGPGRFGEARVST